MPKKLLTASIAVAIGIIALRAATVPKFEVTPDIQSALDHISANSLRGNLAFLASDLLEGRGTPSRGLDIAAEFIAAQYRRAGLEPVAGDSYFQVADMIVRRPNLAGFKLEIANGSSIIQIAPHEVRLENAAAIDLERAPIVKVTAAAPPKPDSLAGKIGLVQMRDARTMDEALEKAHPALLIVAGRTYSGTPPPQRVSLIDPTQPSAVSRLIVMSSKITGVYDALQPDASVSIHAAAPADEPAKIRNVIGILRGSDPALKDTYIVVSAHYDHLGMKPSGDGDRIYNGANDDGSGTVSVIEIASAVAVMKTHPRRSIAFITFFGEEEGLIGSEYYVHHPMLPLAKTVANVELEQVGRTDASDGKQIATAAPTGYDYSNIPQIFKSAGELTGIKVYNSGRTSNDFYTGSDNLSFAQAGIPAHAFCVAYIYPDYHGLADEWQKIDYDNMAKVDRMMALGTVMLADDANAPQWNESNATARRFAEQRKQ
ncbi:MAG TPA: M28 family peptidase [Bryobacteraceae bacterium]|nr:M28 family peptidase [Bryobacteraceae bacterium]